MKILKERENCENLMVSKKIHKLPTRMNEKKEGRKDEKINKNERENF